ncbi:MAG: argininosuccinate synthase [Gammaproteobacteria bacterium]|nr:argininosuccinate synthase [Gammaproteobacteria bacterium]
MKQKIVLAYSGGLDTSCAIKWLEEQYGFEVIAVSMDVGEESPYEQIKEKALAIGASKCHVLPLRERFAEEFILPALQANALYENVYPLVSALSRPLIAQTLVEIAREEGAVAVAHGCTGKGNDQARFDIAINTLDPSLKIVAPQREHPMSRENAIEYAKQHNIPLPIQLENPFSIDQNLWGRSCECGVLEDPWAAPPEGAYELTHSIENAPDAPEEILIEFHKGKPIALNSDKLPLHELIIQLNKIAGKHGIGRIDHIENRLVGIKSREVYEAPAAMTLINAHRALEALTLEREVAHFKPILEQRFTHLIYEGFWYSPLRTAIQKFLEETQKTVSGTVRLKLHKGHAIVVGRKSDHSLYSEALASYTKTDAFDHHAAIGFIKILGLPSKTYYQVNS